MVHAAKTELRARMRAHRDAVPAAERALLSERIREQLWPLIHDRDVRVLHSFLPMGSEVDLFPLLDQAVANGIAVYSPKTLKGRVLEHYRYHDREHLVPGVFGTRHPAGDEPYTGTFDMILVPGLAFTTSGDRLGYGAGYYDTFLPQHPKAFTVAVCFPFQLVATLPVEAHDERIGEVITG